MSRTEFRQLTPLGKRASGLGALGVLLGLASPSVASARKVVVRGTSQQLINCAPTSYDPLTKQL